MKNRPSQKAFTLVEIVIAMTILALISGTVMAILMQAGDTAADIRDTDKKDEEISRFLDLLERTIETLPVDAGIEMVPESESVSGFPEMKITNAVGAFLFGEDIGSAGELTIGLRPQVGEDVDGQLFELAISRDSFSPEDTDGDGMVIGAGADEFLTADSEGRYWLPLVSNIMSATWKYWDEDSGEWLAQWEEQNLPALMSFSVEDSHRPGPVRMVVEIPEHIVNGEVVDSSAADTATTDATDSNTTSSSSSVSRPGGNPGQGQGQGPGGKGFKGGGKGPGMGRGQRGGYGGGRAPGTPGGGRAQGARGGSAPPASTSSGSN